MVDRGDVPLGFGFSLAQNPAALEQFARLSEEERSAFLRRARRAGSKEDMQELVNGLTKE